MSEALTDAKRREIVARIKRAAQLAGRHTFLLTTSATTSIFTPILTA